MKNKTSKDQNGFARSDSDFYSQKTRCAGWLYIPDGISRPAVVIMAHGFAAERTFRLPAFAERFVKRGLAVFLFDYRNFGDSDGTPRNLVNYARQLKDWEAAIAHVRELPGVDNQRIALWGSSFGGGHVIVTAAKDKDISAIVAQVPFVDGHSISKGLDMKSNIQGIVAALRDLLRSLTRRRPFCVPVIGDPDEFAIMNKPGSKSGYLAIVPESSSWKNECPARGLLGIMRYRPISFASRISCPALILLAEHDNLIPASDIAETASRIPEGQLVRLDACHFEVYVGEQFEKAVEIEADFLEKYLK